MRGPSKIGLGLLVLGLVVIAGLGWFVRRGFSAREEPSIIEAFVARRMQRLSVPDAQRDAKNPVPATPAVLAAGRAHFADHCAVCHGNDGRGDTPIGRNLYPKAPDMQAETQALTDGEIFYIIENGVRLTGMPAWGDGSQESATESWHLVHFIRHLPQISVEELAEMRELNPRTLAEWREEEERRSFLEGGRPEPAPAKPTPHHHH